MKKKVGCILASTMALTALLGACGTPVVDSGNEVPIDPTKTQVYVSAWNGGFGVDWLNEAAKRFNNANEGAQVIIVPNKDAYVTNIQPAIKSGIATSDIFITATSDCQDLGIQGYLEDLSDIWTTDVDGNGKTVEGKMMDPNQFKKVYQTLGGTWGLPHSEAMQGFVYDHAIFVDKGYLMTESDGTLTKGKDGEIGTYDDGQPTTIAEWDIMLQKMVSDGIYPFLWNGMYASDYLESLQEALYAQYDGLNNYEVSWSYDGEFKYADGTKETITPATGYKITKNPSKKVVIDFVSKYLKENANYYHPSSKYTSVSHTDAQALFVLGYQNTESNPTSGMLYDGVWWENETRATFDALSKRGETEYKFGTRDYRYMLFPSIAGQRGSNGDGTGSVMPISENGSIFLKKIKDETKRTYAKSFIKYLVSDEVSKLFTSYSGGLRPYNYELGETELSKMSVFAKNAYQLYMDSENVACIRMDVMPYYSQMNYFTTPTVSRWGTKIGDRNFNNVYMGLMNYSKDQYYAGMDSFATAGYWTPIYNKFLELQ